MNDIQRELRHPNVQQRILALAQTTPTDLVRSKLSTAEIQSRALSSLPDGLLTNIPADTNTYSLFQGFQASLPESDNEHRKFHRRRSARGQKLLNETDRATTPPPLMDRLKKEREMLNHRLEMMGIRKNMCSAEIHEIDNKVANLNLMRKIVLDRLAELEMDEAGLDHTCE
jgi:mitochondrial division protein 1